MAYNPENNPDGIGADDPEDFKNEVQVTIGAMGIAIGVYENRAAIKQFVDTAVRLRRARQMIALTRHLGVNAARAGVHFLPNTIQNIVRVGELIYEYGPAYVSTIRAAAAAGETSTALGANAASMAYTTRAIRIAATAGRIALATGRLTGAILLGLGKAIITSPVFIFTVTAEALSFAIPAVIDWFNDLPEDDQSLLSYSMSHPFNSRQSAIQAMKVHRRLSYVQPFMDLVEDLNQPKHIITKDAIDYLFKLRDQIGDTAEIDEYWDADAITKVGSVNLSLYRPHLNFLMANFPELYDSEGNFVKADDDGVAIVPTRKEKLEHELKILEPKFTDYADDKLRGDYVSAAMELYADYKKGRDPYDIHERESLLEKIDLAWGPMTESGQSHWEAQTTNAELRVKFIEARETIYKREHPEEKPRVEDTDYRVHFSASLGDPFLSPPFPDTNYRGNKRNFDDIVEETLTKEPMDLDGIFANIDQGISFDTYVNSAKAFRSVY